MAQQDNTNQVQEAQKALNQKKQKPIQPKVTLVQPNKVTNARYDYTAVQENVLTLMVEAIQKHMTQEKPIQTDLFNQPMITVNASEIAKGNTKYHVLKQIDNLRKKDIEFEYTNQDGKTEDVITGLISAVRNVRDTDIIYITISQWAIPYLLYWGKGVGGTIYSKSIALILKSIYAKRIYKLCKRWEDQGGFTMDLNEFKQMLSIEKHYTRPAELKKYVLEVAKKELKQKADLYFEYDLKKIKSRSYNTISFKIFSNNQANPEYNTSEWYQYVYLFLTRSFPNHKSNKALQITDKLSEDSSTLRRAYNKFVQLDDQYNAGKKNQEDIIKLTKYIIKEDFQIQV